MRTLSKRDAGTEASARAKCLVIRFSSIGDILQAMAALPPLEGAGLEVHWLARADLADLPRLSPRAARVWALDRKEGLVGLVRLALRLRRERYERVYDAHGSLRSLVVRLVVGFPFVSAGAPRLLTRPKRRWRRFLLLRLRRMDALPRPFRAARSYAEPLAAWSLAGAARPAGADEPAPADRRPALDFARVVPAPRRREIERLHGGKVVLAPGAARPMKAWPAAHWRALADAWPDPSELAVLGGPHDAELGAAVAPEGGPAANLAGRLTLAENCLVVSLARLVLAADTGLVHAADLMERPGIVLMGPTALGFPSNGTVRVLGAPLPCRPCSTDGRGRCSQRVWRRCMEDIRPEAVLREMRAVLAAEPVPGAAAAP